MGNSQSHVSSTKSGRRANRLSKPPKSAVLNPNNGAGLADTTPGGHRSSWLNPDADRPLTPPRRAHDQDTATTRDLESFALERRQYERDLDVVPDDQTSSTFNTRESELKRRLSAPEGAIPSFDVQETSGEKPPVPASKVDRRATIQDSTELAASLRVKRDDSLLEKQGSKRYSAFRRESLRTPGIATRVSEKALHHTPSPKVLGDCHRVSRDEPEDGSKDTTSGVSWLDLDSPKPPAGENIPSLRASTPNTLEYSYLGPFRPGSLHVVNGADSPASSGRKPKALTEATSYGMSRGAGLNVHSGIHQQGESTEVPSAIQHPHVDGNAASTVAERTIYDDPTDGISNLDLSHNICNVPPADNGKTLPAYDEMGAEKDFARPSALLSRIASPHLVVTSKNTAMEDDLFDEDEAVDTSTPENAEERCTSGGHGLSTDNMPKDSTADANPTQRNTYEPSNAKANANANGLSTSDSGYSSTSSKGPSQQVCGYFCINHLGNGYDASDCRSCTPIHGNVKEDLIHPSFGYARPVVSAINDKESGTPTYGTSHQSTESHNCSNNPELACSRHASRVNHRHLHRQHMPAETPSSFWRWQQGLYPYEQRVTHQPQPWPLTNDLTIPDELDPNPAERSQLSTEHVERHNNTLRPPRRRSDRATLKKPLPFVQLEDLQQSSAPRSSNSSDTASASSQRLSSSGRYITRIKSLVSVRARQRQQQQQQQQQQRHDEQSHQDAVHPLTLVDDYRILQQEHPYESKPRRNKLQRKSTHFNNVNVAA